MTCKEIADFLTDYLDRSLPLRQRCLFRLHLCLCRDCRRYLHSYKQTIGLAHSLKIRDDAVDTSPVPDALVQAILAARGRSPRWDHRTQ